jgi:hypothetical protein
MSASPPMAARLCLQPAGRHRVGRRRRHAQSHRHHRRWATNPTASSSTAKAASLRPQHLDRQHLGDRRGHSQEIKRLSASVRPGRSPNRPTAKPSSSLTPSPASFPNAPLPCPKSPSSTRNGPWWWTDRPWSKAANLLQGVAWHPSGEFALITLLRTKNLVPMTRINHGWTISNGLGMLWRDGTIDQVLLDQNDLYFPDPSDVCLTPDGRYALVTSSSTDRVAVVDVDKLGPAQNATPHERQRVIPNHLGKSASSSSPTSPRQPVPKGITCSADGARATWPTCWTTRSRSSTSDPSPPPAASIWAGRPNSHPPPRRETVPQREHHLSPPVLLQHLPSGRAHRQHRLRHRRRWHRHGPDRQSHACAASTTWPPTNGSASTPASSASAARAWPSSSPASTPSLRTN